MLISRRVSLCYSTHLFFKQTILIISIKAQGYKKKEVLTYWDQASAAEASGSGGVLVVLDEKGSQFFLWFFSYKNGTFGSPQKLRIFF